jgi:N-methylhydantoinase A
MPRGGVLIDSSFARFSIDTGGTFTDIVVLDERSGDFAIDKVATTPNDTLTGVLAAIDKVGLDLSAIENFFIHGSTTALNALLEQKGVRTAFVTTKGFRDVPEIMRFNRSEMYNPKYRKPRQIVPRELRFEVSERVSVTGEVLTGLDEEGVREIAGRVRSSGVGAIAVCLLHAFRNPAHERRIKAILLEENSDIPVLISSDVAAEHREFERGITTILNAYLAPVVETWIDNLERAFVDRGFPGEIILTKSDGGGMTPQATKRSPINMLLSGPAGGVTGGVRIASLTGYRNLITMDVGGTSFDVAMIKEGRASINREAKLAGYPILISNLDIRTIGAGGGSIAWIDEAGAVHVGPQSAGAVPGPACYGRGGSLPTVTDAFLLNGFIERSSFLGGEMTLEQARAMEAVETHIAQPLGLTVLEASSGILRIAMNNMAEAVKELAAETGDDPRDFQMLCFGGGGPMFGAALIEELGMSSAIIPPVPSTFSAFGMLMIDVKHDVVETVSLPLAQVTAFELEARFAALEGRGASLLDQEGIARERQTVSRSAELRYAGQEHTVAVEIPSSLSSNDTMAEIYHRFEVAYRAVYGYALGSAVEVVNLRVNALGEMPKPRLRELPWGGPSATAAGRGSRPVLDFIAREWRSFAIYDREALMAGNSLSGPALVVERTTSTVVNAGQTCEVDKFGNLVIHGCQETRS